MRNNKKENGISALQLVIIITASIVAAVGIVFAVMTIIKKKNEKRALKNCCCDDIDEWEFDDDLLGDLRFDDDDEGCGCCHCHDDDEPEVSDEPEDVEEIPETPEEPEESVIDTTEEVPAEELKEAEKGFSYRTALAILLSVIAAASCAWGAVNTVKKKSHGRHASDNDSFKVKFLGKCLRFF